jgi:5'-methylthioadenosine phosphorylase
MDNTRKGRIVKVGIIGGSGLYDIDGLEQVQEMQVDTPYGAPSDRLVTGRIGGVDAVFLPRHGRGHRILPGELNHRANIFAMKKLGVEKIVSLSAVGSFREELAPGDMVLVDQFVDRTRRGTDQTFFGNGIVAHVSMAHPTCSALRSLINLTISEVLASGNPHDINCYLGGTYLNMEGPAFSTLAESNLYRSWGLDVIGMTNMVEAKLSREAEICYQTVAMVTDYDCWHEEFGPVDVNQIIATLNQNSAFAKRLLQTLIPKVGEMSTCPVCSEALKCALITDPASIPPERKEEMAPIIGKYIS